MFINTESPVVVDVGSFALLAVVASLLPPFIDCALILDFGESSSIITSIWNKNKKMSNILEKRTASIQTKSE